MSSYHKNLSIQKKKQRYQWTDTFSDEHTTMAVLRGGNVYHPVESKWCVSYHRDCLRCMYALCMATSNCMIDFMVATAPSLVQENVAPRKCPFS